MDGWWSILVATMECQSVRWLIENSHCCDSVDDCTMGARRPLHGRVLSQDGAGSTPNWLANWVSGLAWPSLDTVDEEVTPEFSNFESQCWEPLPRGLRLLPDERGNSCARWKSSGRGLPESFPYESLKQVDFWDYKMENSQPVEKACGVESFRRLCPLAKF